MNCKNKNKKSDGITDKAIKSNKKKKIDVLDNDSYNSFVQSLIDLSRNDVDRLMNIDKDEFVRKTNSYGLITYEYFQRIKKDAYKVIQNSGFCNLKETFFDDGIYLIVGDSHGKHTKTKMFTLLKTLNKNLKFDKIIHVGHILDDDNEISYCWKDFDNLLILARSEELETLQNIKVKENYKYEIIRKNVFLGELEIANQEMISDFVKTGVSSLDSYRYNNPTIISCHRQEFDNKVSWKENVFGASPGCLCEKHIVKTVKQIDFLNGGQVKEVRPSCFSKYRRQDEMNEYWEQGFIIVEIKNTKYSIVPCRVQKVGENYATSYFDKIYIGSNVAKPTKKIFVNADIHCDFHDNDIIDLQEKIVHDYVPDVYVNLGDLINNKSINHHELSKGYHISKDYFDEYLSYFNLVERLSSWAKDVYLIKGNHERFMSDFCSKFPQLSNIFNSLIDAPLVKNKWKVKQLKEVLEIDGVKFIHGDLNFFGQSGKTLEKIAKTFGENTVSGHSHYTSIRFGCHSIGFSGLFNQEYNETTCSRWNHGFAIVNIYKGVPFILNYAVYDNFVVINDKIYIGKDEYKNKKNIEIDIK